MPLRLRTSTVRSKGRTYQYFQLVRAVRRAGRPTHEVVAHLGRLPAHEVEAVRKGLETLSATAPDDTAEPLVRLREVGCLGSLRYLDLMLVREVWQHWGFPQFFVENLPAGAPDLAPAEVLFVLVANRCVAPCSKLRVTEWAPSTVLPELLGFEPDQLNNTRLHRALNQMKDLDAKLSRFLITHPQRRTRPDSVVYLDLTNTWFEGHGGTLGQRGKTKDGAIRRHVMQLALAVDRQGLPLLWEALPGKTAEVNVLPHWIESLATHPELRELPLIFDRGLTSEENLGKLLTAKRLFVTCARESQVEKWKLGVDLAALAQLPSAPAPEQTTLEKLGLKRTDDEDIYQRDQGVRAAVGMENLEGLRVVPFFRPSLFSRNRESLERVCVNVEGKVKALNEELRGAQRARTEAATRKKIEELLVHFGITAEFVVALEQLEVKGKRGPIQSFQIRLTRSPTPSSRFLNCGWMVLLAHPDDKRPALELIRQYHQKEVVEHSFGIIKAFVELRPIHHQTDAKIRAHVTLCILALLVGRALELSLRSAGIKDAIDRVYEALEPCRLQLLHHRKQARYAITAAQPRQLHILKALGLTHLLEPETLRRLTPRKSLQPT